MSAVILWELDAAGLVASLGALPDHFDDAVAAAVRRSADAVAYTARADHPYTNRTHALETSTFADRVTGTFTSDTMHCAVVAGVSYASYVENRGYAFLEPALRMNEARVEQEFFDAVEAAVARSGLQ